MYVRTSWQFNSNWHHVASYASYPCCIAEGMAKPSNYGLPRNLFCWRPCYNDVIILLFYFLQTNVRFGQNCLLFQFFDTLQQKYGIFFICIDILILYYFSTSASESEPESEVEKRPGSSRHQRETRGKARDRRNHKLKPTTHKLKKRKRGGGGGLTKKQKTIVNLIF